MPETEFINLDEYRTSGVRIISGRGKGQEARKKANLDAIDHRLTENPEVRVAVIIPDDVMFVASSFYLGMFGPSIRRFREDGFRARFEFRGPVSRTVLNDAIREAIKRGTKEATKRGSPLPAAA